MLHPRPGWLLLCQDSPAQQWLGKLIEEAGGSGPSCGTSPERQRAGTGDVGEKMEVTHHPPGEEGKEWRDERSALLEDKEPDGPGCESSALPQSCGSLLSLSSLLYKLVANSPPPRGPVRLKGENLPETQLPPPPIVRSSCECWARSYCSYSLLVDSGGPSWTTRNTIFGRCIWEKGSSVGRGWL
jgi:hypothetical protein